MRKKGRFFAGLGGALLCWGLLGAPARGALKGLRVGSPEEDVYAVMGKPRGEAGGKDYRVLFYEGGGIEIRDGKVARIDPRFEARAAERKAAAARAAEPEKDWRANLEGWARRAYQRLTGEAAPTPRPAARAARAPAVPPIKTVSRGGAAVDLKKLTVPGHVTVVDFYADWCGPCRRIAPKLELLARQDEGVYLRKVNIVRWGTEVARQFDIRSIPHIRVYNANGQMVGKPTSNLDQVVQYVAMAR